MILPGCLSCHFCLSVVFVNSDSSRVYEIYTVCEVLLYCDVCVGTRVLSQYKQQKCHVHDGRDTVLYISRKSVYIPMPMTRPHFIESELICLGYCHDSLKVVDLSFLIQTNLADVNKGLSPGEYCERLGPVLLWRCRISNIENPIVESFAIIHSEIPYTDKTATLFNTATSASSSTQSRCPSKVYTDLILW